MGMTENQAFVLENLDRVAVRKRGGGKQSKHAGLWIDLIKVEAEIVRLEARIAEARVDVIHVASVIRLFDPKATDA